MFERFRAQPGQGLKEYGLQIQNSSENISNAYLYMDSINEFIRLYKEREESYFYSLLMKGKITENEFDEFQNNFGYNNNIPKIGDLLRKSRYYLINVHPIGQYSDTKMSERIVNIGGIENEMEDFIKNNPQIIERRQEDVPESSSQSGEYFPRTEEEEKWTYKAKCVVLFSLGTAVKYEGFTDKHYKTLTKTFSKGGFKKLFSKECNYLIRVTDDFSLNKNFVDGVHSIGKNIRFYKGMIKQREILEKAKVKLFVTHGGQNSFNEILKAGVPVIVIPFFGDQPFNATIAEYLGIGLSIKPEDFVEKFQKTFNKIMDKRFLIRPSSYQKNAQEIAKTIKKAHRGQINIFLDIVKEAIEEVEEESPFPAMPAEVTPEYLYLDNLGTIVKKFLKSISPSRK
uniref:glucuronosyltransferase n=1 Tax=Meloidogyne javanica TaxID=6303 RepID=A0A915LEB2_MELJA